MERRGLGPSPPLQKMVGVVSGSWLDGLEEKKEKEGLDEEQQNIFTCKGGEKKVNS